MFRLNSASFLLSTLLRERYREIATLIYFFFFRLCIFFRTLSMLCSICKSGDMYRVRDCLSYIFARHFFARCFSLVLLNKCKCERMYVYTFFFRWFFVSNQSQDRCVLHRKSTLLDVFFDVFFFLLYFFESCKDEIPWKIPYLLKYVYHNFVCLSIHYATSCNVTKEKERKTARTLSNAIALEKFNKRLNTILMCLCVVFFFFQCGRICVVMFKIGLPLNFIYLSS